MADRTIKVTLVGDADKLSKAFKDAETSTSGFASHLGEVAKLAGGVALGVGLSQAPAFLIDAAKAAAEDEAATMRLKQSLQNLGGDLDANMKKVNGAIDSGQKLAFTDDDVRDSFQFLAAATGDADEALRRQQAAMDLARGANIPLAQATKMLGKLNGENVEVFKKLGISLGENATEADALAAVQAKFGGQAEAYAKSTSGQFQQASIRMSELKEQIGTALLPIMTKLGTVLIEKVIPFIERLVNFIDGHRQVFAAVAIAIGTVLVGAFIAWGASAAAAAVATIAATAPLIAIGVAVAALIAGVVLLVTHWDEVTAKFPFLGQAADAVKEKFTEFTGWIESSFIPAVKNIADTIADAVRNAVGFVRDHWDEIRAFIEPALKALVVIIQSQWDEIRVIFETVLGVIKGVVDVFMGIFTGDWERAWNGVKEIVGSIWDGIRGTIENAIGLIRDLAPIIMDAGKALGGALLDGLRDALSATAGFAGDVGAAVLSAVKSIVNTQIIDRINRALEFSFDTHIPGIGTISIDPKDIPHLAMGGIVTRPTVALIGEGGPEAVIPLNRPGGFAGIGNVYGTLQIVLPNGAAANGILRSLDRMAAW